MTLDAGSLVLCAATLPADASLDVRLEAAVAGGFDGLSLWARDVERARAAGHSDADIRAMFADRGVQVAELEPVWSWPPGLDGAVPPAPDPSGILRFDVDAFLQLADAVGARSLNAVDIGRGEWTVDQAVEAFAALCDRAAEHGLLVHVEFLPWSRIGNLTTAYDLVRAADRPNGGIMFDSWHFFRSDANFDALRAVPGSRITGMQLNDAPRVPAADIMTETREGRLFPGEGELDLVQLLSVLDEIGAVAPRGVEVISSVLAKMDPVEVGRRSGESLRAVLDDVRSERGPTPSSRSLLASGSRPLAAPCGPVQETQAKAVGPEPESTIGGSTESGRP